MPTWTTLAPAFLLSLSAAASRGGGASACTTDADCASQEDGDLCNGTLYCDLDSYTCKLNPATVITCPTVDDTGCEKNTCDPLDGTCSMQPMADGHPCDDGDPCIWGDSCYEGFCDAGSFECECGEDSDCDTGDACNPRYCEKATGTCKDLPTVECPDGQVCHPITGACE